MSIIKKIWNISPKAIKQFIYNKVFRKAPRPNWTQIQDGPLKGGKLYLDVSLYKGWQEMAAGVFDDFIYNELDNRDLTGAVVWDIGAHFGYHSLAFASLVGASGRVLAFEPNPFNCVRLKMNLDCNHSVGSRVSVNSIALSNENQTNMFVFSDDIDGSSSSGSHLNNASLPLPIATYSAFSSKDVECRTIDSFVADDASSVPSILKIDVEGSELMVLEGGRNTIIKHRPILLMEIHNILLMFSVQEYLYKLGYSISVLDKKSATLSKCFIVARPNRK